MKIILIIGCLFPILGYSQTRFYVSGETSYSTYKMRSMKDLQNDFMNSSNVKLVSVASFPAYFGYGFSFGIRLNDKSSIGSSFNYNSTGGRLDYEDYSGLARVDQMLRAFSYRAFWKTQLNQSRKWPLFISISPSIVHTYCDVKSQVTLGSQTETETLSFKSVNYGIQPSIVLQRIIRKNFFVQASAGYEIQMTGKLYYTADKRLYLTSSKGDVKADWSGFRFALGVGIFFGKTKVEEPVN